MAYELIPSNGRQSFYGKAVVYMCDEGEVLCSYDTAVALVDREGRVKLDGDYWAYSDTTAIHVREFLCQHEDITGIPAYNLNSINDVRAAINEGYFEEVRNLGQYISNPQ